MMFPFSSRTLLVFLLLSVASFSCKKRTDDSIDDIRYYETSDVHKTLKTRAQRCNEQTDYRFYPMTERCVDLASERARCSNMGKVLNEDLGECQ